MSKLPVTSPVGSAKNPQVDLQLDPGFQLDSDFVPDAPASGLPSTESQIPLFSTGENNIGEPFDTPSEKSIDLENIPSKKAKSNSSAKGTFPRKSQAKTDGESVQEDATTILLALDDQANDPTPDSLMFSSWPYLLVVVALLGWMIYQFFLKRAPSFKHHKIIPRQQEETGPKLSGEFKASQRFQNPKSEIKTATDESSLEKNKTPVSPKPSQSPEPQEAYSRDADRPSDDEFDVGVGDGISDSDVIDEQVASEIVADVDARRTEGTRARFKTEMGEKDALPQDRV